VTTLMDCLPRWSAAEPYQNWEDVEAALRRALRPDPELTVSQWADRYRRLTTKGAAEPGPYRTSRTPYLREIMDALSPSHPARRVVFMKAAQIGATEAGNNWLGYIIHWSPAPVMMVQPTVDMAKRASQQRIEPLIEDCPELRNLVPPARARDSGNTILMKQFPGGLLVMTGANSAVGLRSMPARYAFLDEIDAYPGDVDGEGDPVELVANRLQTFGRFGKMFMPSTPTIHGMSRVEREYEASDQRRFFLPCPHCGTFQWLKFERLRWEKGSPETAAYVCEHCEEQIEERHKTELLAAGEWRATATAKNPNTIGFHISGMYSPLGWLSWEDIARKWENAQGLDEKIKEFKNATLGETYVERGEAPDWQRLYDRREHWKPQTLPEGVTLLTAGVDWQRAPDRAEIHVWGWGKGLQSWAVDTQIVYGRPDDAATLRQIEARLDERYEHPSGVSLSIEKVGVDTGDQATTIYSWLLTQDHARILAFKGRQGYDPNTPVSTPTFVTVGKTSRKLPLQMVYVDVFKAETYRYLGLNRPTDEEISKLGWPSGYVHIPDFMDDGWIKQLVAERRIKTLKGKFEWRKTHERNEVLDCRVYARAALWTMGQMGWNDERWDKLREDRLAIVKKPKWSPFQQRRRPMSVIQDPYV
jgi:phage terminase large subunit GpA-like protein